MTNASPPGLREDYESSPLTLAALAAKYDLSTSQITRLRLTEGWRPRPNNIAAVQAYRRASLIAGVSLSSPPVVSPGGQPADPSPTDGSDRATSAVGSRHGATKARAKSRGSPAHRKDLIGRIHDLIDMKIAEVEQRVASRTAVSAADSERESKAIGFFIKQLEQLKDVADAEARTSRAADAPGASADPDAARDAERLRQTLVERLDRIRRARADAPSAG